KETCASEKKYSVTNIRVQHSNAYRGWSIEEDGKLKQLRNMSKNIDELADIFKRKKGAISSRLKKFEL
ncbi:MAG: hypothetical protein NTV03_02075, partial [Candidatus Nomurabacteria bacterium]|nr:hypothetical protein [Candidatus Nomurabacteria bacterium]